MECNFVNFGTGVYVVVLSLSSGYVFMTWY